MPVLGVIGIQWGDEGKGKIIDLLAAEADIVARYAGGNNAGHTVVLNGEKFVLHLVPSGSLHPSTRNVIGNGVVVDPQHLFQEIQQLESRGVAIRSRLFVSARAHAIFAFHRELDALAERWKGAGRLGTTGRGIGPTYSDKAARIGIRICDLLDVDLLSQRLRALLVEKNAILEKVHGRPPIAIDEAIESAAAAGRELRAIVCDTGELLRSAAKRNERILLEGAQGAMLDIDHGTYPYVTSSSTLAGGFAPGTGLPPRALNRLIGVAKSYSSRVGEGPFLTEQINEIGEKIRKRGNEYGSTTGRPRRCGWFDAVAARYACQLSGVDEIVLTSLDVLGTFPKLNIATEYVLGSATTQDFPAHAATLDGAQVRYEEMPGWDEDIRECRDFAKLPKNAQRYVERIESLLGVPIAKVSVGPDRSEIIHRGGKGFA
jgi:adenylosuccinate synthase